MSQTTRDLDHDAGEQAAGLRLALDVAAPAAIDWDYARQQYEAGRWDLVAHGASAALIVHTGVADHKSTTIIAMAGDLSACPAVVALIEDAATNAGSSYVVFMGRRGWVRAFPGYEEKAVFGVKEL